MPFLELYTLRDLHSAYGTLLIGSLAIMPELVFRKLVLCQGTLLIWIALSILFVYTTTLCYKSVVPLTMRLCPAWISQITQH